MPAAHDTETGSAYTCRRDSAASSITRGHITMRTIIERDPFAASNAGKPWNERGQWPCSWICSPDTGGAPFVTAYRLPFTLDRDRQIRVHVTADERYELFLDGGRVGRGSERGDPDHWYYETYDL